MTLSGSLEWILCQRRLWSGWFGTMAEPESRLAVASLAISNLRSASRWPASWPWQRKQVAARMGRTSRLNEMSLGVAGSLSGDCDKTTWVEIPRTKRQAMQMR